MRKLAASSFKLLSDAHGAIAIQVAVALPVLIGFTALGIEMTTLFVQQKRMQSAADAAVVAAGSTGLTTAQSLAAARAIAGANGFVNGTNGTVVTLNTPPTGGTNISTQSAREIIISRPYPLYLAKLFSNSPITIFERRNYNQQQCVCC